MRPFTSLRKTAARRPFHCSAKARIAWLQAWCVPFDSATKRPNQSYAKSGAFWGVDGTFDDSETNITTLNYLFTISPDTQWRTVVRSSNYKRSYWASAPGSATSFATGGSAKTRQTDTDNFVIQSDLNTTLEFLGMSHEVVTGVEYLKEKAKRWSLANVANAGVYYKDVVGVVNGVTGQLFDTRPNNTYDGDTVSAYVQDTVEFIPDWKLTAGVRRDEMKSDYLAVSSVTNAARQVIGTTTSNLSVEQLAKLVGAEPLMSAKIIKMLWQSMDRHLLQDANQPNNADYEIGRAHV